MQPAVVGKSPHPRNQFWWYSNASKICCRQNLVSSLHIGLDFHRVWRIFPIYSLMGQLPSHCYIIQVYKHQLAMTQGYKFDIHNSVRIYTCGYVMPREFLLQIITGLCFLVDYNIHKISIFLSLKVFIKSQLFIFWKSFFLHLNLPMYSNYMYALVPIIAMQLLSFDTQIQLLQVTIFYYNL